MLRVWATSPEGTFVSFVVNILYFADIQLNPDLAICPVLVCSYRQFYRQKGQFTTILINLTKRLDNIRLSDTMYLNMGENLFWKSDDSENADFGLDMPAPDHSL